MTPTFTVRAVAPNTPVPSSEQVSSASILAINAEGKMLVTKHVTRGIDIPGGHVEAGEDVLVSLAREIDEETGGTCDNPEFIATVTVEPNEEKYAGKRMCIFLANNFALRDEWTPAPDVSGREVVSVEEFLQRYEFDKEVMRQLMEIAQTRLLEREHKVALR